MKGYAPLFLFALIIISCSSPEKLMQQGNYDAIIDKSIKSLIKNPNEEEDASMLDKAYKLANERDLDRIKYLKLEDNPNTWDEMLSLYSNLKNRQASVKRVMPLKIGNQTVQYDYVDYDAEIVAAKRKAADYYYNHGRKLMENKTKDSYREAYYEFVKARNYSGGSFANLDQMINDAEYLGISRALINVVNRTVLNLPQEFLNELIAVNASDINSQWVEYYTRKPNENMAFDYYIDIILQSVNVSPDLVKDKDRIEKKKIDDGFQYVLDTKGNVMKDTAGNDIKIKKYKEIQCTVIESYQTKDCNITGEIDFLSANPETLLTKQPVAGGMHFEYVSARAVGDLNALTPETKKLVDIDPVPFPDDLQMTLDCAGPLKQSINEVIKNNRGIIR
jgi:hypothetical protein